MPMNKYLVLVRPIPGMTPRPQEPGRVEQITATYQDTKTWAKFAKSRGHVTDIYGVSPNQSGIVGAGIAQANSAEEIMQHMGEFPMAPFVQLEVLSLTDFEQHMDTMGRQIPQHFKKS